MKDIKLNSRIWGPHYWFVLLTIAISYPPKPNSVTKKKYYEFIQNLPLFLPNENISNHFAKLLDKYPVTPYLDSREMFTRWVHFIHNRINVKLGKPSVSLGRAMGQYYDMYKEEVEVQTHFEKWKRIYVYAITIVFISILCYFMY